MANIMLRIIIAIPLIMILMLILAAGGQVWEPVYNATNASDGDGMTGAEDGFGQDQATAIETAVGSMTVVAGIGLVLVVVGWMIFGDLSSDVNQGRRRI